MMPQVAKALLSVYRHKLAWLLDIIIPLPFKQDWLMICCLVLTLVYILLLTKSICVIQLVSMILYAMEGTLKSLSLPNPRKGLTDWSCTHCEYQGNWQCSRAFQMHLLWFVTQKNITKNVRKELKVKWRWDIKETCITQHEQANLLNFSALRRSSSGSRHLFRLPGWANRELAAKKGRRVCVIQLWEWQ